MQHLIIAVVCLCLPTLLVASTSTISPSPSQTITANNGNASSTIDTPNIVPSDTINTDSPVATVAVSPTPGNNLETTTSVPEESTITVNPTSSSSSVTPSKLPTTQPDPTTKQPKKTTQNPTTSAPPEVPKTCSDVGAAAYCKNGGGCRNSSSDDMIFCRCTEKFAGKQCEIDIAKLKEEIRPLMPYIWKQLTFALGGVSGLLLIIVLCMLCCKGAREKKQEKVINLQYHPELDDFNMPTKRASICVTNNGNRTVATTGAAASVNGSTIVAASTNAAYDPDD